VTVSASGPLAGFLDGPKPRRVGVVMLSALGDAVHVLPVVTALKRHAPATHVTWVLQPGPARLVEGHTAVDDIVRFERAGGWREFLTLRRALRERPFDLVLAMQPYFKAGLITWFARADVKLGFDRARARDLTWLFTTHRLPARPPRHVQDQFFEFLDALGVPHGEPDWGLAPTLAAREEARARLPAFEGPLVGVVVATTRHEKNWTPERYAQLAVRLRRETGARCVLLGGATPLERAAADVVLASGAEPIDGLGTPPAVLLGQLDACDLVVSPDTGPLHICVALNVPVVGLYGYMNPKRVGPYRRFGELVVDAFAEPGEDCPVSAPNRPGRMTRITVEDVFEKARLGLSRYAPAPPWRRAGTASG
jgi:heptosyltransferase I